jgi:hypothetical protein
MTHETQALIYEYLKFSAIGTALGIPIYLMARRTWPSSPGMVTFIMAGYGIALRYSLLRASSGGNGGANWPVVTPFDAPA